jgi:hypothetical protein
MLIKIECQGGPTETCDWADFSEANADAFTADELEDLRLAVELGMSEPFGGGAGPLFIVSRVEG